MKSLGSERKDLRKEKMERKKLEREGEGRKEKFKQTETGRE